MVVTEIWRGRLWSAVPHRVVQSSKQQLITWVAAGTQGTYATSRGIPGRENLSRAERKLAALRTGVFRVVEVTAPLSTLHFYTEGAWASVNLGWNGGGQFLGWYVDFQVPPQTTPDGISTMDLVLDALVDPAGTWLDKDEADFEAAVADGLLSPNLPATLEGQRTALRGLCDSRRGPFAPKWLSWTPPTPWSPPELPATYAVEAAAWRRVPS